MSEVQNTKATGVELRHHWVPVTESSKAHWEMHLLGTRR